MAATSTSSITELGGKYVLDRECGVTNGAYTNVTGATGSIFMIQINNEANSATKDSRQHCCNTGNDYC